MSVKGSRFPLDLQDTRRIPLPLMLSPVCLRAGTGGAYIYLQFCLIHCSISHKNDVHHNLATNAIIMYFHRTEVEAFAKRATLSRLGADASNDTTPTESGTAERAL